MDMLTLNMLMYVIGCVTVLVGLMWGVSQITAYLLLAHYDWKTRRNSEVARAARQAKPSKTRTL